MGGDNDTKEEGTEDGEQSLLQERERTNVLNAEQKVLIMIVSLVSGHVRQSRTWSSSVMHRYVGSLKVVLLRYLSLLQEKKLFRHSPFSNKHSFSH